MRMKKVDPDELEMVAENIIGTPEERKAIIERIEWLEIETGEEEKHLYVLTLEQLKCIERKLAVKYIDKQRKEELEFITYMEEETNEYRMCFDGYFYDSKLPF